MAEQQERGIMANPLENLPVLEKKIAQLIDIVKAEKALNVQLTEQNAALTAQLRMIENSLLKDARNIEELNQEREMTKLVVDELIGSIDRLMQAVSVNAGLSEKVADEAVAE